MAGVKSSQQEEMPQIERAVDRSDLPEFQRIP